jgi:hypothetical protein
MLAILAAQIVLIRVAWGRRAAATELLRKAA